MKNKKGKEKKTVKSKTDTPSQAKTHTYTTDYIIGLCLASFGVGLLLSVLLNIIF